MSETNANNRSRQEDEVTALSHIYNRKEFSFNKDELIQCYYNTFFVIDNLLRLDNVIYQCFDLKSFPEYFIKYLPPVRIYLDLPLEYPSKKSPNFYIICTWLSPWQISFVCQKLDEIWLKNMGQEILFLWFEFLRNDLLSFLKIIEKLDISFMYMIYYNVTDYFKLNLIFQYDARAIYNAMFSDPIKFLTNYDKYQEEIYFKKNYYMCTICLDEYCGRDCIKLKYCEHIYCKKCMQEYIATKINENNIKDIPCPDLTCKSYVTFFEVKHLCPHLFLKYEKLLLQVTLNTMKDVIFCPRIKCHNPLIKDSDNTLAICNKCDSTFCSFCYKTYHGSQPCEMSSNEMLKLIEGYKNANRHEKRMLEKKYGRKQIQIIVERHLTKEYLEKYAKPCPNCSTMISKTHGCNKMTCIYCNISFCWLCGMHITLLDPYKHFNIGNISCYKLLFDEGENF